MKLKIKKNNYKKQNKGGIMNFVYFNQGLVLTKRRKTKKLYMDKTGVYFKRLFGKTYLNENNCIVKY